MLSGKGKTSDWCANTDIWEVVDFLCYSKEFDLYQRLCLNIFNQQKLTE